MEDELARARRALGSVSGELDVTWDDVLERAAAEREFVPVLPLGSPRSPERPRARRMAVAAGLAAALALGIGTTSYLLVGRGASTPPAGSGPVASSSPVDGHGASSASAQVLADRARDALGTTAWCGAVLQTDDPRTALELDAVLEPTAIDDARGKWVWNDDGGQAVIDARTGAVWKLESAADLVADRPDLQATVAALRLLVDDGGTWRWSDDGTPHTLTVDVDGVPVAVAVDPQTDLPAWVTTAGPTRTFDVTWLSCARADDPPTSTTPPGGTGSSTSP